MYCIHAYSTLNFLPRSSAAFTLAKNELSFMYEKREGKYLENKEIPAKE